MIGSPEKIFLSGHSAGAYRVSLLSIDARYLKSQGMPKDLAGEVPIIGFFWVEKLAPDRPKDTWGIRRSGPRPAGS